MYMREGKRKKKRGEVAIAKGGGITRRGTPASPRRLMNSYRLMYCRTLAYKSPGLAAQVGQKAPLRLNSFPLGFRPAHNLWSMERAGYNLSPRHLWGCGRIGQALPTSTFASPSLTIGNVEMA
jgi:hypothetical protein